MLPSSGSILLSPSPRPYTLRSNNSSDNFLPQTIFACSRISYKSNDTISTFKIFNRNLEVLNLKQHLQIPIKAGSITKNSSEHIFKSV